ncbi:MAG: GNAT family N-acetyltransferase [Clostridia bacterium]|nr:GNAT family N-acetyltransferase [Clostridia bacterium]
MPLDYADVFTQLQPDFFASEHIRSLPAEDIFDEQILDLRTFSEDAVALACPAHITFGLYRGDMAALHEVIREVEDDWTEYFNEGDQVYCAFEGDQVVSFCLLDEFGVYEGMRIGGPGCVGTIPRCRKQGIGLKMVQKATAMLKDAGFDMSYIHYTHVGHWYARLGYQTVVRWNSRGIVTE